jgi:hypothetical protein
MEIELHHCRVDYLGDSVRVTVISEPLKSLVDPPSVSIPTPVNTNVKRIAAREKALRLLNARLRERSA